MKKRFVTVCLIVLTGVLNLNAEITQEDIFISADEAIKLIDKKGVVFVTGDSQTTYELGHIKGSVQMYAHDLHKSDILGKMECKPLFRCIGDASKYIGDKGIDNDTLVIAYDDFKGPNATGVYVFFKSYGHKKIKILNGGRAAMMKIDPQQKIYDELKKEYKTIKKELKKLKKSKTNQRTIDAKKEELDKAAKAMKDQEKNLIVIKGKEPKIEPKNYFIDISKIDHSWIAGKKDIKAAVEDILKKGKKSKYAIIDARSMDEIIGERKMDGVARGGHIPGAKFIEWKNFTDFKNKLSFKELDLMQEIFDGYKIKKSQHIYTYCQVGSGRGTQIVVALKMLGYKNAKVYTGSWDEWGNDMNLPLRR